MTIVHLRELGVWRRDASGAPAPDSGNRTLHIRCGHDIMEKLAASGFEGDFLCFADPYVQGPVPRTQSLEEFVRIRASFVQEQAPGRNVFDELYAAYRSLERAREYDAVHIWLEHDSYDQLVLAKLLHFFSEPAMRPPRLSFISVTQFPGVERFIGIGQLPGDALRVLWREFREIREPQFALGRQAWDAITSPTPETLLQWVESGTPAVPTLAGALARHLRELPSVANGLSLTEALTLEILADKGPMSARSLFRWYTTDYEPLPFLGDSGYWTVLRGLAIAQTPALRITQAHGTPHDWGVALTPFGERLLEKQGDWLHANAVERWVGGVRIDSCERLTWRFDDAAKRLVRD